MPKIAFQNSNVPAVTPLYPAPSAEPPMVLFTIEAELTVRHLVRAMDVEVAWFGLVRYEEDLDAYVVYKILIPEQEVTAATVDITANAIAQLTGEILDAGDDPSHLRYHGHSHVNMPASPSPTDQEHLSDYLEHTDWFIREIRNKKGDYKLDVFDKRQGVVFQCVHRDVYEHLRDIDFFDALDELIDARVIERRAKPPVFNARNFTISSKRQEPRLDEIITYDDLEDRFYAQLSDPFFVKGN
ncbi:hypothetical protein HW932_01700 [Allochromatium humboldtianum]|uniref:Uncharacterized protein n=1 Tax=Allochromatium humboldtianum TaxID=504901 RepID=A0A850RFT2_9GAMM|nr:hypothetical protein [Allochromatium humboldtianum]NVZ07973.1 hypothetical protein [Allochromatium humboldtianum]